MSSALSFRGVGPLRGAGTGCAGMQSGQESGAGAARFHAVGFIRLHVLCVWLELPLRYAVWETVRAHFQRGTSFRSMQPPRSSALCANIARFFLRLRAHGLGATLGGRCPPKTPWQEPEVPAPPTSAQTHAAALARPRSARTLRASFCACGARARGYVRGTLSP